MRMLKMGMPDQRHQRLGAVLVHDLRTVGSRHLRQFRQRQDHGLALAGLRRILDKGIVQRAAVLGVWPPPGRRIFASALGGCFLSSRALSSAGEMGAGFRADRSRRQQFQDGSAHKRPMRRMARADRSARSTSGIMPGIECLGLLDDAVHRFLADLGILIDQQRATVETSSDCTSASLTLSLKGFLLAMAVSTSCTWPQAMIFDQVGVGEQRRIFQDRAPRRSLPDHAPDSATSWGMQSRRLISSARTARTLTAAVRGQAFQGGDGERQHMQLSRSRQAGHQPGDLDRQFRAHIFGVVVGQHAVAWAGSGRVGGDGGAVAGAPCSARYSNSVRARHRRGCEIACRRSSCFAPGADFQNVQRRRADQGPALCASRGRVRS